MNDKKRRIYFRLFLYTENPALGAGFKKAYSYEQKKNSFDTIDEGLVNRV